MHIKGVRILLEEQTEDLEVLELFEAFLLAAIFRPYGLSAFVGVELDYLLIADFARKFHYDSLEIAKILKSGALVASNIINQKDE